MANGTKFEVHGLEDIFRTVERKLGRQAVIDISNDFAKQAGKAGKKIVQEVEGSYRDTGATVKETTYKVKPGGIGGVTYVSIGWKGPKQRVKLVHLNEFGYARKTNGGIRRIRPKGFGKLESTLAPIGVAARMIARKAVVKSLQK
ncbi:hypothetical protein OIT44_04055 [Weissella ceti]|uniref:HK97 gp10 family phage protein n=1 Tax=Weissella ceti TaxID=759620 RepID=A0ABT3E5R8_9LACO|nr:hypothetical protein [Weissella ceti]MCW0953248.1 hypothetical protein [Weissella ceti]QVK12764.1 hypothetical protein KHQ31_03815 [Weissella ceti]